ncbi:hypothetical protein [Brevibacterium litoralis]|uniref:hypothetical protein n=1 Tax=Brevibacterium litoralis TaxID=3138935 RepID=UPI0032EDBA3B
MTRPLPHRLATVAGPVLTQHLTDPPERMDLGGPVLSNWVHKSHGLLTDLGVGPVEDGGLSLGLVVGSELAGSSGTPADGSPAAEVPAGLHWRALALVLAAWTLDTRVHLVTDAATVPEDDWIAVVSDVALRDPAVRDRTGAADEVLVYALPGLALRTEVEDGYTDYLSTVRTYPDQAPLRPLGPVILVDADGEHTLDGGGTGGSTGSAEMAGTVTGAWQALLDALGTREVDLRV